MNAELRLNEGCSLRLRVPTGYPRAVQNVSREITEVFTMPALRRRGFATQLLKKVCQEADASGFALLLRVKPYINDNMESEHLLTFYKKHGFQVFQAEPTLMCRPPTDNACLTQPKKKNRQTRLTK